MSYFLYLSCLTNFSTDIWVKVEFSDVVKRDGESFIRISTRNLTLQRIWRKTRATLSSRLDNQKNDKEPQYSSIVWRWRGRIKTGFYLKKTQKTLLYKLRFMEDNSALRNCIALIIIIIIIVIIIIISISGYSYVTARHS